MDLSSVATVVLAVLGLLVGSLLTTVIARVPDAEPVLTPGPRCPACHAPIRGRDAVPVASWFLLRRRCRDCGAPISARYPLVEVLTAAMFVLVGASIGLTWALPAFLYLTAVSIALAVIDLDTKRLPNALTLPAYPVMAGLLLLPTLVEGSWGQLGRALLGGAGMLVFYLALALIYPAGMGMGDVKLAGTLGAGLAWLGWGPLLVGGFLAFLLGAVIGLGLMVLGRAGRRSTIPFGPFMVAGTLLGIVVGQQIADWYVGTVVP